MDRTSPPPSSDRLLEPRKLILSTIAFVVLLFAAVAALWFWLRGPLVGMSASFVERFGGPGVAIGFFLPDAFLIPFPNDTFALLGLAGGLGVGPVIAWGTGGSILGGCTGWLIGRKLRRTRLVERLMATGRGRELEDAVRRRGALVVAVAAITPLPYSVASWAAGAVGMPLGSFVLVSLTRVIRVASSVYIMQLGQLSSGN